MQGVDRLLYTGKEPCPQEEEGVVVGSDVTQEWLLPWWWKHYRRHNALPVAFVDFGMSFEAKDWCRRKGKWIPLRVLDDFVVEKTEIDPLVVRNLEAEFGTQFWNCRTAWFKKPLACLKSPFRKTIWIDLDCEVRSSIQPLFSYVEQPSDLSMAKEQSDLSGDYLLYNSGVVVFRHRAELLCEWASECVALNGLFRGDQEVFSHMIAKKGVVLRELPASFNWSRRQEENSDAVILHWHGVHGKAVIRHQLQSEQWLPS